jgi:hypothetical protein
MDGRIEALKAELQAAMQRTAELKVELDRRQGTIPPGTVPHYTVIELAAREAGAEVRRLAQQMHLRQINAEHLRVACCPGCGEYCEVQPRQRKVTALDGPVELDELVAHCPAGRRDFFPPAAVAGAGRLPDDAAGGAADRRRRR